MLRQVRSGLTYANVMATIAVFLALGGGAYAALSLPKNSVGSKQIKRNAVNSSKVKNRSLLAADFKAGQLPAGPQGLQGLQGVQGIQGIQGQQGDRGLTGPTAVFQLDSAGAYDPPATGETALTQTTVNLPVSGRLMITATMQVTARAKPSGDTVQTYGVYLDGQAVPNTKATMRAPMSGSNSETVVSVGVTGVLAPGAHTIQYSVTNDANFLSSDLGERNIVSVLVGG
jgi:hypothetical protein